MADAIKIGDSIKNAILESPQFKLNQAHYDSIIAAKDSRKIVYEEILQPYTGDAFFVKAGQILRLEQRHEQTQIADWWWVSPDLKTTQSQHNSQSFSGMYLTKYHRIWSHTDGMRPMATMVADEAPADFKPHPRFGSHFWMSHCQPVWHQAGLPNLPESHPACHVNCMQGMLRIPAVQAIEDEQERRDMVERLADLGNYQTYQLLRFFYTEDDALKFDMAASKSVPYGNGVEFYAEMDVYAVISSCPWANQGGVVGTVESVPLYISVWDTGIAPLPAAEWKDWKTPFYEQVASGERDTSVRTPDSYNDS
ncbi:DUF1989 domain-containing protein [Chloroflexi bacterium TSY]|nr:DUF1989 domain-containing protein [Chloroflexi bacterium TSY]